MIVENAFKGINENQNITFTLDANVSSNYAYVPKNGDPFVRWLQSWEDEPFTQMISTTINGKSSDQSKDHAIESHVIDGRRIKRRPRGF